MNFQRDNYGSIVQGEGPQREVETGERSVIISLANDQVRVYKLKSDATLRQVRYMLEQENLIQNDEGFLKDDSLIPINQEETINFNELNCGYKVGLKVRKTDIVQNNSLLKCSVQIKGNKESSIIEEGQPLNINKRTHHIKNSCPYLQPLRHAKLKSKNYVLKYFPKYFRSFKLNVDKKAIFSKVKRIKHIRHIQVLKSNNYRHNLLFVLLDTKARSVESLDPIKESMISRSLRYFSNLSFLELDMKSFTEYHNYVRRLKTLKVKCDPYQFLNSMKNSQFYLNKEKFAQHLYINIEDDRVEEYSFFNYREQYSFFNRREVRKDEEGEEDEDYITPKLAEFKNILSSLHTLDVRITLHHSKEFAKFFSYFTFLKYITNLSVATRKVYFIKKLFDKVGQMTSLRHFKLELKEEGTEKLKNRNCDDVMDEKTKADLAFAINNQKSLSALMHLESVSLPVVLRGELLEQFSLPASIKFVKIHFENVSRGYDCEQYEEEDYDLNSRNDPRKASTNINPNYYETNKLYVQFFDKWTALSKLNSLTLSFSPNLIDRISPITFTISLLKRIKHLTELHYLNYRNNIWQRDPPLEIDWFLNEIAHLGPNLETLEVYQSKIICPRSYPNQLMKFTKLKSFKIGEGNIDQHTYSRTIKSNLITPFPPIESF